MDTSNRNKIIEYYKKALKLDSLVEVSFKEDEPFIEVEQEIVEGDSIDEEDARILFDVNSRDNDIALKPKKVVVSICTLVENNVIKGLVNVPATITEEGQLSFDKKELPWIPKERLETPTYISENLMVGNLSDFWKYRKKMSEDLSQIDSKERNKYFEYAKNMFTFVEKYTGYVQEQATKIQAKLITNRYYIKEFKNFDSTQVIYDLYEKIESEQNELPLFDRMISLNDTPEKENDTLVDDGVKLLTHSLASNATTSASFPLADSQRRAMHAFTETGVGEVLAVSGPPGTGKTTMLQAIVGSMIVTKALEGKTAPLIVGTSTNNQAVTNILDSFENVAEDEHKILDFRWLPKYNNPSVYTLDKSANCEMIKGIGVYCPAFSKIDSDMEKKYIIEQPDRKYEYKNYSDSNYISFAKRKYIDSINEYSDSVFNNIADAKDFIFKRLKSVDNDRKTVLNSAWNYLGCFHKATSINELEDEIVSIKDKIEISKNNLDFWMQIDHEFPKKRLFLFFAKRRSVPDESIIASKKREIDSFDDSLTSIEEIITFYTEAIRNQNNEIYEQNTRKDELVATRDCFIRAYNDVLKDVSISKCFVNQDYSFRFSNGNVIEITPKELINNLCNIEPKLLFKEIDKYMDITLRYYEFWLSIHYYEARWLELVENGELIEDDDLWMNTMANQNTYWSQAPNLTPCFVMTEYQLPKYFPLYVSGEKNIDFERIDLLVTDEAGQVNTPIALAGFSLAKRAIVVGDTKQLAPIWGLDGEIDKATALDSSFNEEEYVMRKKKGLTCSEPASIMLAAENACKWKYSEEAGLFLEEHYRCVNGIVEFCNKLLYNNRLKACRGDKSNVSNILKGKETKPFITYIVNDSEDKQSGLSRMNEMECNTIVNWICNNKEELKELYKAKKPKEKDKEIKEIVAVVTPFAAQARIIEKQLNNLDNEYHGITVGTAHALQGAERPIVLFSATYGNNSSDAKFINNMPNLMNVAVSRAKDLFILFAAPRRKEDKGKVFSLINSYSQEKQLSFAESEGYDYSLDKVGEEDFQGSNFISQQIGKTVTNDNVQEKLGGTAAKICPNCGKKLIIRNGGFGKFYGCSGYPKCTYTKKI